MPTQLKPQEQKILHQVQLYLSQNKAEFSKNIILEYIKSNNTSQYLLYFLSLSHAILGELDDALVPANSLVNEHANNIEYLKLLGGIYHGLKQYDQAITIFEQALKLNNQDFQTLSNLASSLKETNQYVQAELLYKQSLTIHANQPDALTNYGLLMQSNARLDEAIHLHKESLQIDPWHINALYNLAYALKEKGDNQASLSTYNKLLMKTPNHIRALSDAAQIYLARKQPEQAISLLERAKFISSSDVYLHLNLGIAYKIKGLFDKAEASFNDAICIDPTNQTPKYYLSILKGDSSFDISPDNYVQELFDNYAETFDEQLVDELQYNVPSLIGDLIKTHVDHSIQYDILDLGCGTGLVGSHLHDISSMMIGVDLSSKMLKKAKDKNIYDDLVVASIDQYFKSNDFKPHIIVSADVFIYIGNIAGIFNDVSKILQKNGIFAFSTEDTKDTDTFMLKDSGRFAHNEKYIRSLAESNCFNIIDIQKTIIRYEANEPIHGQLYILKNSTDTLMANQNAIN